MFTVALTHYHNRIASAKIVQMPYGGKYYSNYYEYLGMSEKDIRKYVLQSHRVVVPKHIAKKIEIMASDSPHWHTLLKAAEVRDR